MRLDSLVRLIQSSDFMAFRELALECLSIRGYRDVTLTDGWKDGGTDLRVYDFPPNPTKIAFQITVEKNWQKKLQEDAKKAKDKLNLVFMTLVCSRRVQESDFDKEKDVIWATHGVQVNRIDSQSIASTFFENKATGRVLDILGIDVSDREPKSIQSDPRTEAAYSFSFFGQDAESFRELAVESTIINIASESTSIERDSLITRAADLLRLSNQQRTIIDSAVDRLIQRKDITGKGKVLKLNDELAEAATTMRRLRIAEETYLRKSVGDKLKEVVKNVDEDHVSSLMEGIGALLIEYAKDTVAALEVDKDESLLRDAIKRRLRHLHETLDSLGVPDDSRRTELLSQITEIAANSELGRHLFAGELFLGLSSVDTPGLIRAFGARTGIQVILDASVAIPMLCTLLYRAINNRFSIASRHVYDQLTNHGQPLLLPIDYLEEVATHLLRAFTDYQSIADIDPDLISSENSFVSHYVGMRNEGDGIGFLEFLDSLGLDDSLRKSEFYSARDMLKNKLQRLFDRYNIKVTPLGRASQQSFKRAQEGIAYAINKFGRERPKVLMQHDARTIAYLHDRDRSNDEADVLCTWDGVHFWMRERETADWLVMNPAVLGDVFAIARSSDYEGRLFTPVVLSMQLSEEASEKGASVWDAIVKLERGSTSDAKLIESAKEFKKKFIENKHSDYSSKEITKQWKKWKTENFANK